jgi:hypothetical protein
MEEEEEELGNPRTPSYEPSLGESVELQLRDEPEGNYMFFAIPPFEPLV